jgi:hypothetical protein
VADTDDPRPGEEPDGRTEQALRRALAAQAGGVEPGPAPRVEDVVAGADRAVATERSGRDTDRGPARRWPAAVAVAAGIAVLAVASAVALRPDDPLPPAAAPTTTDTETVTVPATPAPGPSAEPTTEPTATSSPDPRPSSPTTTGAPAGTTAIVWAVREQTTRDGVDLRLVPERVVLSTPGTDGSDGSDGGATVEPLVRAAVDHLLSSPAADPDHTNPWWWDGQDGGDRALDVAVTDGGTVVDLPAEAFDGPVGGQAAGSAIAAMVRTVVSNGGAAPVTLLVDGRPDGEVWGAYVLDEPLEPTGQGLANGWILDPYEGQRLPAGTVTVSGTATAFEANVLWEVTDADGAVVADGFTMAGANGEYGPFSFDVDLAPGRYTVAVREQSMAGPDEGPDPVWEETTTIEVVP